MTEMFEVRVSRMYSSKYQSIVLVSVLQFIPEMLYSRVEDIENLGKKWTWHANSL